MSSSTTDDLSEGSTNVHKLWCKKCKCLILRPNNGTLITLENQQLPLMEKPAEGQAVTEIVDKYWKVTDIYSFENMGFSNTVESRKFLACAECEVGPLGFHDLITKESFLAIDRVTSAESVPQ